MRYPLVPSFDDRFLTNPNLLSHYTDSDKAIKWILNKNELKFTIKSELDDPIEHHGQRFMNILTDRTKKASLNEYRTEVESLILSSRIGCFCMNVKNNQKRDVLVFNKGYLRPRMWSQYGKNHTGVCLVFHKNKLYDKLSETIRKYENAFIVNRRVSYTNKVLNQRGVYKILTKDLKLSPKSFIEQNARFFLFTKFLDYKDEQEYRFVVFGLEKSLKDFYIDIQSFLVGIICGYNFHPQYIPIIQRYAKRNGVPAFKIHWAEWFPRFEKISK